MFVWHLNVYSLTIKEEGEEGQWPQGYRQHLSSFKSMASVYFPLGLWALSDLITSTPAPTGFVDFPPHVCIQ